MKTGNWLINSTLILLLAALTSCYQEQHSTLDTAQGQVAVTESTLVLPERLRGRKQMHLPASFRAQLENYRRHHGFFPLTIAGFAADSDSARASVAELRQAGFTEVEFLSGGQPDSARLAFWFAATHRWTTSKTIRSHDQTTVNQATTTAGAPVVNLRRGSFGLRWAPEGRLVVIEIGR